MTLQNDKKLWHICRTFPCRRVSIPGKIIKCLTVVFPSLVLSVSVLYLCVRVYLCVCVCVYLCVLCLCVFLCVHVMCYV